jgi:hypothetical protein
MGKIQMNNRKAVDASESVIKITACPGQGRLFSFGKYVCNVNH